MINIDGTTFILSIILYAGVMGLLIARVGIAYEEWRAWNGEDKTILDYLKARRTTDP